MYLLNIIDRDGHFELIDSDFIALYNVDKSTLIELTDAQYQQYLAISGDDITFKDGSFRARPLRPTEEHEWDGKAWVISPQKQTALLAAQRAEIRAKINAKRDECVNGGVYVPTIEKWVDSDDKGRSTLVEIKADFDLNGKDNTYTLICADNTAKTINFNEFKAIWDAAKNLKEKAFENAYMHKVLLEQSADPLNYNWSIGWATTYAESIKRGA